ncbi:uncharacterized protein LOC127843016 [Dreissena polymorpha]|nr:uncharacterized protein LOC127843016 [Dreissena polymorpha]
MLPFAVVLLCIVAGVFGDEPSEPLPSMFRDENGNEFSAKQDGPNIMLYNSSGALLSNILNENGWVVVLDPGRNVCVIVDPNAVAAEGDCFEEVPYSGVVPENVQKFCDGKDIVEQVKVDCEEEQEGRKKRQLWPKLVWSRCCRYIPVPWWPCSHTVCILSINGQCVAWGCRDWHWHWHWVRICIWGYHWPWWG